MKRLLTLALACTLLTACKKDTEKTTEVTEAATVEKPEGLAFENKVYEQKSSLLCKITSVLMLPSIFLKHREWAR